MTKPSRIIQTRIIEGAQQRRARSNRIAPGSPSWAELSTIDEAGALAFYNALFGWVDDPQEMGPNWYYHLQTINGVPACSLYQQSEKERCRNVPPHWNTYLTVENVEETMAAITQNGGAVVVGPMDVFEAGRMAMCQDPQGALFAIWQPKQHIGARIKLETGTMCWHELLTTDSATAIEFYQAALGMERGEVALAMDYPMLKAGGTEVAGISQIPPNWVSYLPIGPFTLAWMTWTLQWRRPIRWAQPSSSLRWTL